MNVIIARHQVEEVCDQDGECDVQVWVEKDGDITIDTDADVLHDADREVIIIRKEIRTDSD